MGADTSTFKSLNLLVPGGVTDIHVGYTLLVPSDVWSFPTTTYVAAFTNKVRMLTYGIMGPKAEACGLNVGFTSIKRELTGVSPQHQRHHHRGPGGRRRGRGGVQRPPRVLDRAMIGATGLSTA